MVLRIGELGGPGAMIEQVKGFSYSPFSLLGPRTSLHKVVDGNACDEPSELSTAQGTTKKSWWRLSFASPKVRNSVPSWYCHSFHQFKLMLLFSLGIQKKSD